MMRKDRSLVLNEQRINPNYICKDIIIYIYLKCLKKVLLKTEENTLALI